MLRQEQKDIEIGAAGNAREGVNPGRSARSR
jgi:hypothetical protein